MRTIREYDRLYRHIRAWVDGDVDSLFVLGEPGTGKSTAYRDALGNRPHHLFTMRNTPMQVYCELHDAPNKPIVFDDVSALLADPNFLDMLKGLCETGTKRIR